MLNETTPGVQCPACPAWWRSDGKWMGGGDNGITKVPLEGKLQGGKWEQGLVVRVYDDMLTIERREFSEGVLLILLCGTAITYSSLATGISIYK